jgi:hypothetical protein
MLLALLAAWAMADAARFGWGAATIEGDRVKWGLRSIGRSPLQPVIVVKDFCRWRDGPRGLCALETGSDWAALTFRAAAPAAWIAFALFALAAPLLRLHQRTARMLLGAGWLVAAATGVAAVLASHQISVFVAHAADPGWSGSLTWRAALAFAIAAFLCTPQPPATKGNR